MNMKGESVMSQREKSKIRCRVAMLKQPFKMEKNAQIDSQIAKNRE